MSKAAPDDCPPTTATPGDSVSTAQLAKLLRVDERHLRRLASQGWIPRPYRLVSTIQGFLNWRDDAEKRRTEKYAGKRGLVDARTRMLEWHLRASQAEYVRTDEVFHVIDKTLEPLARDLAAIPALFTSDRKARAKLAALFGQAVSDARAGAANARVAIGPASSGARNSPEIAGTAKRLGARKSDVPFRRGRPWKRGST